MKRTTDAAELTGTIIADFRATVIALKCAASERLLQMGVSMAQLNILYTLQRSGDISMSGLADALNVSLSNATGLVDRMEERGYIERSRVPEDRRVVMVRLAPGGVRLLDEHDAMTSDLLRGVLRRLRPEQVTGVATAMSAMRSAIEATTAPVLDRRHAQHAPAPTGSPASTTRNTGPSGRAMHDHPVTTSTRRD